MLQIKIYTKEGCIYCEKLKEILYHVGAEFVEEHTLGLDFQPEWFTESFGTDATFPQVLCRENDSDEYTHVGGVKQTIDYMECHGRLTPSED